MKGSLCGLGTFKKGCCVCDHGALNHRGMKYFDLAGKLGTRVKMVGDEADNFAGTDHRAP